MYQGKWNNLSQVLNTAVDSGVVHSDQRAIWTTWKVSMEAWTKFKACNPGCSDAGGGRSSGVSYEASCE